MRSLLLLVLFAPAAFADGPKRATTACESGVRNFPFLKPWVEQLENFIAPVKIGSTEGSLFYAIGITTTGKNGVEAWKTDKVSLDVNWKNKGGKIESGWLGEFQPTLPRVAPGPGTAVVRDDSRKADTSQMGGRRSVVVTQGSEPLPGYGADAVKSVGRIGSWARLWSVLYTPAELLLLDACTDASCKIKFDDRELKTITGASHQYRIEQFAQVVRKRIDEFKARGEVRAYEGTHLPMEWRDLPIGSLFPSQLHTHFWLPPNRGTFGYEVLDAEPGHHKPVVAIFGRQCEPRGEGEKAYVACTDLVVYNNHYFDFWARTVFIFPWCDVKVVLAYETVDIDQVKNSRLVRILFGGEMRKLFGLLLETRLKRLHMLGF